MSGTGTNWAWQTKAYHGRRMQIEAVSSALLKLDMMGFDVYTGLKYCEVPHGIHPFRWKAMLLHAFNNKGQI